MAEQVHGVEDLLVTYSAALHLEMGTERNWELVQLPKNKRSITEWSGPEWHIY